MLRAVLVGLLSVSAVACKSSEESAKVQPGVAAGKVVEVRGTVTVRRDAVARPLAVGETVEGSDIIETGADGSVVIELSHNLARWELGANRTSKVSESVAWSLPKKTGEAKTVEQTSAAAGRHAERSAAETSVSASADAERESAPAAESAAAPPAAAPAPAAAPRAPARAAAAPPAEEAPPPPPPAPSTRSAEKREADADGAAEHQEVRGDNRGAIGAIGKGGGTATGQGAGAGSGRLAVKSGADAAAAAPTESPSDIVLRHERTIKACLTKDMPAVSLRIAVGANGKATVVVNGKTEVPAAVKRCVTNAVQKLKFPAQAATVTIEIMR